MKRAAIILASALTVGSINVLPALAAGTAGAPTTAPSAMRDNVTLNSGASASEAADTRIGYVIDKATDEALTPHAMHKLVSLFSGAQQERIAKSNTYSEGYGQKLDSRIESISKTWKEKYGHDFSLAKSHNLMNPAFASIRTETPGHPGVMEAAIVSIKNGKGEASLDVPLTLGVKDNWKIDVPASLTAERLRDNLQRELTALDNQSAHWPANEMDAYRIVTRHVLSAVLDQPMPAHTQASAKTAAPAVAKTGAPAVQTAQQSSTQTPVASNASSTHHWWKFW
jgi:hypothetical protein